MKYIEDKYYVPEHTPSRSALLEMGLGDIEDKYYVPGHAPSRSALLEMGLGSAKEVKKVNILIVLAIILFLLGFGNS